MDSKIIVVDNAVLDSYSDSLLNIVSSEDFKWQLVRDIANNGNKQDDISQYAFRHLLWWENTECSEWSSWFKTIIDVCAEHTGGVLVGVQKVWVNMNMNYGMQNGNLCHCDGFMGLETKTLKRYTGIYYINDSDGDTLFYSDDGETVIDSVSPQKNRIVIFPSAILHSRQLPLLNNTRLVLNLNVLVDTSA